ncbi:hypothetical protein AMS68_002382 [Peltaster fructicola]|uniref:Uncharacterized protein n=1 Tax=Peltaster fructicola TaxID=286661 RepID=A0A6H0XQF1_9PEZI|nr:hypothetical protein AMS68_002382 [Peltaster fructicola]
MDTRSSSPMDIDPVDSTRETTHASKASKRARKSTWPAEHSLHASKTLTPLTGRPSAEDSIHTAKTPRRRNPEELRAARELLLNAKTLTPQRIAAEYPQLAAILARPVEPPKPALKRLRLTSRFSKLLYKSTDSKPKTSSPLIADQTHKSEITTLSPLSVKPTDHDELASTPNAMADMAMSSPPSSVGSPVIQRRPLPALPGAQPALEFPETLSPEARELREDLTFFQFKFVVRLWHDTSQRHRRIFERYNELPIPIKNRLGQKVMADIDELNQYASDIQTMDYYLGRLWQHDHLPLVIREGFKALQKLLEGFGLQEVALDHLEAEIEEDEDTALKKYCMTAYLLQDKHAAVQKYGVKTC